MAQFSDLKGGVFIDGTFGGGGMTAALLEAGAEHVIAIDQDKTALTRRPDLEKKYQNKLTLMHGNFSDMRTLAENTGVKSVSGIVLDLGMSSDQLDDESRGFAFRLDGPLDMRMDKTKGETAAEILNTYSEQALADIFKKYGDEPKARPLARSILKAREIQKFETTKQFLIEIEKIYPLKPMQKRSHPALRIFQALRIQVNREMDALEAALPQAVKMLKVGGRLCVIAFHSLEDRFVKNFMRDLCKYELDHIGRKCGEAKFKLPVKKIKPSTSEIEKNPRSRSAHLRVLERVSL